MTQNFNTALEKLLKTLPELVDKEGNLLKQKVKLEAEKFNHELIKLLLENKETKAHFFDAIDSATIFNYRKFVDYIDDKNFLLDSYTKFSNKIGLTISNKHIKQINDVVLSFPFKDCVLEGGQSKDDEKRKEIFFNEVLVRDEINRLLDKKVLTNAKKYNKDGVSDTVSFKRDESGVIKDNLIIKGNNLLALHTLKSNFAGKVKLIYIDPPYNTGNDSFNYNDNFNHSTWLTFMKNRLEVARELLSDDGVIFVQCDYRESAYLKVLMDEIFNRDRFVNEITWQKYGGVKNQALKKLTTQQEAIFIFSKSELFKINMLYNELSESYVKAEYKYTDEKGRKHAKLRGRGYQGGNKKTKIKYLDENLGSPITSLWIEEHLRLNTSDSQKIKDFIGQKPETLLERIIDVSTKKGDIVLDYHLGSGTTCAVAHKMGRQYIGIEQMDYIEDIAVERMKKVIGKEVKKDGELLESAEFDNGGISKSVDWQGGGEFIYFELAKYNQAFIDEIAKADENTILKCYDEIIDKAFLNYDVEAEKLEKEKDGFKSLSIDNQKEFLISILNKNQLYKNLSEMGDKNLSVDEKDKQLTKDFYGE